MARRSSTLCRSTSHSHGATNGISVSRMVKMSGVGCCPTLHSTAVPSVCTCRVVCAFRESSDRVCAPRRVFIQRQRCPAVVRILLLLSTTIVHFALYRCCCDCNAAVHATRYDVSPRERTVQFVEVDQAIENRVREAVRRRLEPRMPHTARIDCRPPFAFSPAPPPSSCYCI